MKYFIYCRKSSEAEDRQILSIESQLSALKAAFDGRPDLEIAAVYEESFSAKGPGRPVFNEMISRIEAGHALGIIAWAPDRLARNSIDGGRIVYLLDRGVLQDLKFATYSFENNSQGKFMLQIMFGQSKYYSDALSENVKRGNRTKIQKRWRPNQAPIGYLNDRATKTIVLDEERAPIVKRMFHLMLTGAYSPRRICTLAANEWGLRTIKRRRIGGKAVTLSATYKILTNPFYAGILEWQGKLYPGAHESIISIDELDRVRALLTRRERPRPQSRCFAFTGMIRCGECEAMITAENKSKTLARGGIAHYTYYHCTKRKFDAHCGQRSVRGEILEAQIQQFLASLFVTPKLHAKAIARVGANEAVMFEEQARQTRLLQKSVTEAQRALSNLTSLRVRELISDDEFLTERRRMDQELLRLTEQAERSKGAAVTFEPQKVLLSFSSRATDWFVHGDCETKRLILETIGSNRVLIDGKLHIEVAKPFCSRLTTHDIPNQLGVVEDVRTMYASDDPEWLKLLDTARRLEAKYSSPAASVPQHAQTCPMMRPLSGR